MNEQISSAVIRANDIIEKIKDHCMSVHGLDLRTPQPMATSTDEPEDPPQGLVGSLRFNISTLYDKLGVIQTIVTNEI